jgi:type II secretory pathway pseudopilin PulG
MMRIQRAEFRRRKGLRVSRLTLSGLGAFTMIEIAISLAIIGFALVAIIGILPFGMNTQKDNRQDTIVNQDHSVFMNAIRNGERGVDDLTNYVMAITNYTTAFNPRGVFLSRSTYGYTLTNSTFNGAPSTPLFPLINGHRIIGLLSTPKFIVQQNGAFTSNHVVAFVRSISGPASEKFPQNDATVQQLALNYRLAAEVIGCSTNTLYDPNWTNFADPRLIAAGLTNEIIVRSNYMRMMQSFQVNLHDLRLTFRWPLLPTGEAAISGGRQVYRTTVTGMLVPTNEPGFLAPHCTLFFFEPYNYKGS